MIELEQFPKNVSNNSILDKTNNNELNNRESLLKDKDKDKSRQSLTLKKSFDTTSKSNKDLKKPKKNTIDDIDINLSVEDINKKLDRQEKISTYKLWLIFGYLYLALQFTNCSFICVLSYFRPPLLTNDYYCYDLESKNFYKCTTQFLCKCEGKYCVLFCYEKDISKCYDSFQQQYKELEENGLRVDLPIKYRRIEQTHLIYKIDDNENLSLFQRIGMFYCYLPFFIFGYIFYYVFCGFFGYYLFGILSDIYGKRKIIIVLSICLFISFIGLCVIANYQFYHYFPLLIILWMLVIMLLGFFLLSFESAIYVFILEYAPLTKYLKIINCILYERYFLSLIIYCFVNNQLKNIIYYFYFYEGFLFIFIIVFIIFFYDSPRFYSEHQNIELKKKSFLLYLIKGSDKIINDSTNPNNETLKFKKTKTLSKHIYNNSKNKSKNITYKFLKKKIEKNKTVTQKYPMILILYFTISYCFYTTLISMIFNLCDHHQGITIIDRVFKFLHIIGAYTVMLIPSYFCLEILDLDKYVTIIFACFCFCALRCNYNTFSMYTYRKNMYDKSYKNKDLPRVSLSFWIITLAYSIYEMMLLMLSPTLYRTYLFFLFKGIANFSILLAYLSVYLFDCPVFIVGMLAFLTSFLLFIMKIRWKFDSFEEEIDNEKDADKED